MAITELLPEQTHTRQNPAHDNENGKPPKTYQNHLQTDPTSMLLLRAYPRARRRLCRLSVSAQWNPDSLLLPCEAGLPVKTLN
jgi:hypothetical protein